MRVREFLRLEKRVVSAGAWSDKRMPKTSPPFPLSASKAYRLGLGWRWRLVRYEANDRGGTRRTGRLLIAYRRDKQDYQAWCGLDTPKGTLLVGRLEWHASHDGWHAHALCGELPIKAAGFVKPAGVRKVKRSDTTVRGASFAADDKSAILYAQQFFGFGSIDPIDRQFGLFVR